MAQIKYGAPADYAELYDAYGEYVQAMLVRYGIDQQDAPEAKDELLLRFVEKGGLTWYDPEKKFRIGYVGRPSNKVTLKPDEDPPEGFVQTGERTAAFMGMFKTYVFRTAMGMRDKIYTQHAREALSAFEQGPGEGSIDSVPSSESEIVLRTTLDSARHELSRRMVAKQVVGGKGDLARLFAEIERMMEEDGKIDRKVLASRLGVSVGEVAKRIKELRAFLVSQGLSPQDLAA